MDYRSEPCIKHSDVAAVGLCASCAARGCAACLVALPNTEFLCQSCIRARRGSRVLPVFATAHPSFAQIFRSARLYWATPRSLRWIWCTVDEPRARGLLVLHALAGMPLLWMAALFAPVRDPGAWLCIAPALGFSWVAFQVVLSWVIRRVTGTAISVVSIRLAYEQPLLLVGTWLSIALAEYVPASMFALPLAFVLAGHRVERMAGAAATLALLGLMGAPIALLDALLLGLVR